MLRGLLLIVALMGLVGACGNRFQPVHTEVLLPGKNCPVLDDTILVDAATGKPFSRLEAPGTYGMKFDYQIPPELLNHDLLLTVSGKTRSNRVYSKGLVVVSTNHPQTGQASWDPLPMAFQYTAMGTWCSYRDSVQLRSDFYGKKYTSLSVYTHLAGDNEQFDVDQLKIVISKKR